MTTINLNLKVKGGPRTPVDITCYGTAVNEKVIKFANGFTVSETEIVRWVENELHKALKTIQDKPKKE